MESTRPRKGWHWQCVLSSSFGSGDQPGEGGCSPSRLGGRKPGAAGRWGPGAGLRPSRALSLGPAAQQPASPLPSRSAIGGGACRSEGAGALLRGSRCRRRCLPSSRAGRGDRQGSRRQPGAGDGKLHGRAPGRWQSFPGARIGAPSRWPPVTARRRVRRFLIWGKKSTSVPLSGSLSPGGRRRERQTWAPRGSPASRQTDRPTELWRISGLWCSGAPLPGAGQGV